MNEHQMLKDLEEEITNPIPPGGLDNVSGTAAMIEAAGDEYKSHRMELASKIRKIAEAIEMDGETVRKNFYDQAERYRDTGRELVKTVKLSVESTSKSIADLIGVSHVE